MQDVTLNQREQTRLQVLNTVLEYQLPTAQAAEVLGISERLAIYGDRHGVFKFSGKPRHIPQPVGHTQFTRAMGELGIQQVFARSPQAKGRVERMAGTFQDRLVSEFRLAGARTIQQVNDVLRDFLPRFNAQFRVPAQQPPSGLPPAGLLSIPGADPLLQALAAGGPGQHRQIPVAHPAVATQPGSSQLCRGQGGGLGESDGQRMVQYGGEVILHQEAALPQNEAGEDDRKAEPPSPREATPRQQALWKAVHHTRLQGVTLRGIARELGISRNTVREYADSLAPPVNRTPWRSTQSATRQNAGGHFP